MAGPAAGQAGSGDGTLEAPPGALAAYRLVGSDEFVILEWPLESRPIPDALTRSEREVMRLLLQGATNKEIARARGTSIHTVANQVASILQKLGAGSRLELFARHGR